MSKILRREPIDGIPCSAILFGELSRDEREMLESGTSERGTAASSGET